ncbi:hypothetical protein D7I44_07950 [Gryllotalpicola protaetiae]|uniref:Uncharacterized protein n=1 Tax=Gryllotalpicola protaetiae TaxID=2419771 RepID=A0A387BI18_9MICO|nr:hypothetical protein D7I44_07950 [Gryllotalpicola protaetiae]
MPRRADGPGRHAPRPRRLRGRSSRRPPRCGGRPTPPAGGTARCRRFDRTRARRGSPWPCASRAPGRPLPHPA